MEAHQELIGKRFKVEINGRKSLNGALYGVEVWGDVTSATPGDSIYNVAVKAIQEVAERNKEMEYPESIRVTVAD